jgi:hypothetical protein
MPQRPPVRPRRDLEDGVRAQAALRRTGGTCGACGRPGHTPSLSAADGCWFDRNLGWRDELGRPAREWERPHTHEPEDEALTYRDTHVDVYPAARPEDDRPLCRDCARRAGYPLEAV